MNWWEREDWQTSRARRAQPALGRGRTSRWARVVAVGALLVFVVCLAAGAPVVGKLITGGLVDNSAPSAKADAILAAQFGVNAPNFAVVLESRPRSAPASAAARSVAAALRRLHGVQHVQVYRSSAKAGGAARELVVAYIADGPKQNALADAGQRLATRTAAAKRVRAVVGGTVLANSAVSSQVRHDFEFAEGVTFPVTALALIWVFGSLWAALIPLATGLIATAGTLAVLRVIVTFTPVSVFTLNLATGLSLALAIDYSLLLVSRYREERSGYTNRAAVRRTLRTAGRTVVLSACTVALSLAALAVFPMAALRSFAYAGVAVVIFTAASALTLTPALLTLLGKNPRPGYGRSRRPYLDRLDIRRALRRGRTRGAGFVVERSAWYRVSGVAMRHAVSVALAVTAVLVLLGLPFLSARWGPIDDRVLPTSSAVRQVGDAVRNDFGSGSDSLVTVLIPRPRGNDAAARDAARLSAVPGITEVAAPSGLYRRGHRVNHAAAPDMADKRWEYLTGYGSVAALSPAGSRLLGSVRGLSWPAGTLITGPIAENSDTVHSIASRLPDVIAIIALATFLVVFLLTRSVLLPLKALLLTTLSLTASFGVLVWVFQEGHLLQPVFGSSASGFLVPYVPVIMFCLAFGMSMDYEVFLLSRITEEWRASPRRPVDSDRAVQLGLAKTGRVVTSAALFMVIVFAGLATSRVTIVEMIGTGLALFVFIDSTLLRALLLPALMHLVGRANWWSPFARRKRRDRW